MACNSIKSGFLFVLLAIVFSTQTAANEAIPVVTNSLANIAVYPELRAPASVISNNNSRLSAEVSARITSLPASVGEQVEKGQVIVRLEQRDLQLAVEREQAKLEGLLARIALADYELKRAISLSEKQAVSEQLLKQREADLTTLLADEKGQRATLQQAKRNLDKTIIRAPFQAVVLEQIGQMGELAVPGTPLIQIVDTSSVEVSAKIQAHHADEVEKAKSLFLISGEKKYPLQLRTITAAVDPVTRTREARLLFKNHPTMPGSAGELVWVRSSASLPSDLLVKRKNNLGVFIYRDSKAYFHPLPGAEEGRPAIIDLPDDTQIIIQGQFRLQDGETVSRQSQAL